MNILKPSITEIRGSVSSLFAGLGLIPSLCIVALILLVVWYAYSGIFSTIHNWNADRKVEAAINDADEWKAKAETAGKEANQYQGAAAAYKQQAEVLTAERTELLNARPELQQKIDTAKKTAEAARTRPIRPIDNTIQQRINDLGTKLDQLYPER